MVADKYFVPYPDLLPYWPFDLLPLSNIPGMNPLLFQGIGFRTFRTIEHDGYFTVLGRMAVEGELSFEIPGLKGVFLVLGDAGGGLTVFPVELKLGRDVVDIEEEWDDDSLRVDFDLLMPPYAVHFPEIEVKLRFGRDILTPAVPKDANDLGKGFDPAPDGSYAEFVFTTSLNISTESGLTFGSLPQLDLDYVFVGDTQLVIKAEDVVFDFSESDNVPDFLPEGVELPAGWKGIFFRSLSLYGLKQLWEELPVSLSLENWYISDSGVSGETYVLWDAAPSMSGRVFALRSFTVGFQSGALVKGLIQFAVKLEFFEDAVLYFDAGLHYKTHDLLSGYDALGWSAGLSSQQPDAGTPGEGLVLPLYIADLNITGIGVRHDFDPSRGDETTKYLDIILTGDLKFDESAVVTGDLLGGVELGCRELVFQITPEFEVILPLGVWITLSEEISHRLGPCEITVSRYGFGQADDGYWIGLDAGVKLIEGIPAGTSVSGLKIYFGGSGDPYVEFDGIGLQFTIAEIISVEGFVGMTTAPDPYGMADDSPVIYRGRIGVDIIAWKISGQANIMFGEFAGEKFFYLALDIGFPSGIPFIGASSIYGFCGLAGINVAPNKLITGDHGDDFNWYHHWYKPSPGQGAFDVLHPVKWTPLPDNYAFGLGMTVGTSFDTGWTLNLKGVVMLTIPGYEFIIAAKANLLKPMPGFKDSNSEAALTALLLIDFDDGLFQLSIEFDYRIPESGILFDMHADAEVYFDADSSSNWHIYAGRYAPPEKRIRSKVLKLSGWEAYLMLDGAGLKLGDLQLSGISFAAGGKMGFDERWKLGPVRVVIAAWFAFDAALSSEPFFLFGQVTAHGELSFKIWGFGFGLGLHASLAAQGPEPFKLKGMVRATLGLPWPLPDVKVDVELNWGDAEGLPEPLNPLVENMSLESSLIGYSERVYSRTEQYDPAAELPMDGRIIIAFRTPMAAEWEPAVHPSHDPEPDQVGDKFYRYILEEIFITVEPLDPELREETGEYNLEETLTAEWVPQIGDSNGPASDRLALFELNPFSPILSNVGWPEARIDAAWIDSFLHLYPAYPCGEEVSAEPVCIRFDEYESDAYDPTLNHETDDGLKSTFRAFPYEGSGLVNEQIFPFSAINPMEVREADPRIRQTGKYLLLTELLAMNRPEAEFCRQNICGVRIEVPLSNMLSGHIIFDTKYQSGILLLRLGKNVVHNYEITRHEFEVKLEDKEFDNVILWFRSLLPTVEKIDHVFERPSLYELCYMPLSRIRAEEKQEEMRVALGRKLALLDKAASEENLEEPTGSCLIHEPNSIYKIRIKHRADIFNDADDINGPPHASTPTREETFEIRTSGPPADISPYVEWTYPADGAVPVYPNHDLQVSFNRIYVEAMYRKAGEGLHARVFDMDGREVDAERYLEKSEHPALTPENEIYVDTLSEADCMQLDLTKIPSNDRIRISALIQPATQYQVKLYGDKLRKSLFEFQFTTSLYGSFNDHIEAFDKKSWSVVMESMEKSLLNAVMAEAESFDEEDVFSEDQAFRNIWFEHLGLANDPDAEKPEITTVWDRMPNERYRRKMLLFKSPEPLFNRKRVSFKLKRLVRRTVSLRGREFSMNVWQTVNCRAVRTADETRCFIIPVVTVGGNNRVGDLPQGSYRMKFIYRMTDVDGERDLKIKGVEDDLEANLRFRLTETPEKEID